MAIEKKLIHFGKLADFEAQLTAGNILDYSIVFIQDAKKIWTHGTYYDCSEGTTGEEFWYLDDTTGKLTTDYDIDVLADLTASRLVTGSIAAFDGNEYTTGNQGQVLMASGDGNMHWGDLSIPTKVSELANDKGFLDQQDVDASCVKKRNVGQSIYANVEGLDNGQMAYALPTSANGDEDDVLLSRSTVKTINGESIVGSGDITISGGGSSSGSGAYPVEVINVPDAYYGLHPNTYYIIDGMTLGDALHVTLNEPTDNSIVNEYIFEFYVENVGWGFMNPLILPDTIKFANDVYPDIKGGYTYVISIINNLAIFAEFSGDETLGGGA